MNETGPDAHVHPLGYGRPKQPDLNAESNNGLRGLLFRSIVRKRRAYKPIPLPQLGWFRSCRAIKDGVLDDVRSSIGQLLTVSEEERIEKEQF